MPSDQEFFSISLVRLIFAFKKLFNNRIKYPYVLDQIH